MYILKMFRYLMFAHLGLGQNYICDLLDPSNFLGFIVKCFVDKAWKLIIPDSEWHK